MKHMNIVKKIMVVVLCMAITITGGNVTGATQNEKDVILNNKKSAQDEIRIELLSDTALTKCKDYTTAYVYYDVFDQNGNSIRESVQIMWTSSPNTIYDNRKLGRLEIKNTEGEFRYGNQIYLVGAEPQSGASVSWQLQVGLEHCVDTLDFAGVNTLDINKNAIQTKQNVLGEDFITGSSDYYLLFRCKDRNGCFMDANEVLQDMERSETDVISFSSSNPLLVKIQSDAVKLFTVDTTDYLGVKLIPGDLIGYNGNQSTITVISGYTGAKSSFTLTVSSGTSCETPNPTAVPTVMPTEMPTSTPEMAPTITPEPTERPTTPPTQTVYPSVFPNAQSYTLGTTQYGSITEDGDDKHFYQFSLPSSGKIDISGLAYMRSLQIGLYDEDGNEIWDSDQYWKWNSTTETIVIDESVFLTGGIYYLGMEKNWGHYGNYSFNLVHTATNESFGESNGGSNNSIALASFVETVGRQYIGQIAQNDTKDFYCFTLFKSGTVNLTSTFYNMQYVQLALYDESGVELLRRNPQWNNTTREIVVNEDIHLTKGTYYLSITEEYNQYGKYDFSLKYASANESFEEINAGSNNGIGQASNIGMEKKYRGQIAINDEKDFYKFSVSSSNVVLMLHAEMEYLKIYIYDTMGNEIKSYYESSNNATEAIDCSEEIVLSQGTYYLAITRDGDNCGNYDFSLEKLTSANCDHDFDSKWHDATHFTRGFREYVCSKCGYSYYDDYSEKLTLGQGYISSSTYAGKKKIYLYWSTVYKASGYQIRYSTDKSFKRNVIKKNIKGQSSHYLKISKLSAKKKYYIQVRPYIKKGSEVAYGKWSSKKCIKTK